MKYFSSRTCPTCRNDVGPSSLIKVYVENDQSRLNDLHEDLLKTNEKLSKDLTNIKDKANKQESELIEINMKFRDTSEKLKQTQREKQLDDMKITTLNIIKEDSTKEILKLNTQITTLKLDLLAERQLRRIHQTTLQQLDPKNENYDLKSIAVDGQSEPANYTITPFWQLSTDTAKSDPPKKDKNYVIPSKIQKANESKFSWNTDHLRNVRQKRSSSRETADRPALIAPQASFKPLINDDRSRSNSENAQSKFTFGNNSSVSSLFQFGASSNESSNNASTSNDHSSNVAPTFRNYRKNTDIEFPKPSER